MPFCDFARDFTEAASEVEEARKRAEREMASRRRFARINK